MILTSPGCCCECAGAIRERLEVRRSSWYAPYPLEGEDVLNTYFSVEVCALQMPDVPNMSFPGVLLMWLHTNNKAMCSLEVDRHQSDVVHAVPLKSRGASPRAPVSF